MSSSKFHGTTQELRKLESKVSRAHGGKTPADSDVSLMKVSSPLMLHAYKTTQINMNSPFLTPAQTNRKRSKKPKKISLFQNNPPSPATGTQPTSEPSTLGPVASRVPFRVKATVLFADRLL